MNADTVLEVRNLRVAYRQGATSIPALRDISLSLQQGDAYGMRVAVRVEYEVLA